MANVLVTGGAGYIGSVCATELLRLGHKVLVVDDLSTGHRRSVPAEAKFYQLDIADRKAVRELLAGVSVDVVFHFAARALIAESVSNPGAFFDHNLAGGIAFCEELRRAAIVNFVFSSTAAVYGNPSIVPIPEDHPKEPVNAYGESKLALERVLRWYASSYRWTVVAFRYFNACGSTGECGELHDPETHILPLLLQTASGRRPYFEIYGADYDTPDGTCLRDYVHVSDIADAHLLALKHMDSPGFRVYNIGAGVSYSVRQVCDAVVRTTGAKLNMRNAPRRPGDPSVLCASPEKLIAEFGWHPQHSDLDGIVESAWRWEKRQAAAVAARQG
ncbi:MAG: UDP-glucose 4-epimerase GalE [Terriglobales bacterium]